jgi:hypothetical protein
MPDVSAEPEPTRCATRCGALFHRKEKSPVTLVSATMRVLAPHTKRIRTPVGTSEPSVVFTVPVTWVTPDPPAI